MSTQQNYTYLSKVVFCCAVIYLILFFLFSFNYRYKNNVNFTQSFATLFFAFLILSFLTYNSLANNEFNYLLFYFTFIGAIPLIYHCLYLLYFKNYTYPGTSDVKIGLVFVLIAYLSLVWFNIKHMLKKNVKYTNNVNLIKNALQILFTVI